MGTKRPGSLVLFNNELVEMSVVIREILKHFRHFLAFVTSRVPNLYGFPKKINQFGPSAAAWAESFII